MRLRIRCALKRIRWILLDVILLAGAMVLAVLLRYEWEQYGEQISQAMPDLLWIIPIYLLVYLSTGIYNVLWRYAGRYAFLKLGTATLLSGIATMAFNAWLHAGSNNTVLMLTCILAAILTVTARVGVRTTGFKQLKAMGASLLSGSFLGYMFDTSERRKAKESGSKRTKLRRVLIIGAGDAAAWVIDQFSLRNQIITPVALLDDNIAKRGFTIHGVRVVGAVEDVVEVAQEYGAQEIIIAMPSLDHQRYVEIASLCAKTKMPVKTVSEPQRVDTEGNAQSPVIRKINASDFLPRNEMRLDDRNIRDYLTDKVVLITGGGGSIGSEICRQVMKFSPKKLVIFDIYENTAYELLYELKRQYGPNAPIDICIGSVQDVPRLNSVFDHYRPSVVFHAAAHKHVPLMEAAPMEAIKNNIFGTRNVLQTADQHGVERFVILSTDKAVNPTNVMGATKRVAEMLIQSFGRCDFDNDSVMPLATSGMKCMAVRFGNVLGSHGSVIPLLTSQIESGGPVTLTHPDIERFFMTIPEAAQLVLQAGGLAQGGAVYVLDMGQPVRIRDLAERLIRFYGYEPGVDMEIEIIGLRPGEKLYEELMMDEESTGMKKTAHNRIMIAPPMQIKTDAFWTDLAELEQLSEADSKEAVALLQKITRTFRPQEVERRAMAG
jgi:FlaA1/EpsC-like NDP-sugar epimerase